MNVHIPKTAGSTFQTILSQVYDPYRHCSVYPSWWEAKDLIQSIDWKSPLLAISGHFPYGLHRDPEASLLMHEQVRYTTFLRDPVDRVVSHYNYLMNSDDPRHREMIAEHPTLESFLEHPWARDMQTCFLTGWDRTDDRRRQAGRRCILRTELLRDRFEVVGLTERFDESLILFAEAFGWVLPPYTSMNRSSDHARRIHVEDLPRSLIDKIKNRQPLRHRRSTNTPDHFSKSTCATVPAFAAKLTRLSGSARRRACRP